MTETSFSIIKLPLEDLKFNNLITETLKEERTYAIEIDKYSTNKTNIPDLSSLLTL